MQMCRVHIVAAVNMFNRKNSFKEIAGMRRQLVACVFPKYTSTINHSPVHLVPELK